MIAQGEWRVYSESDPGWNSRGTCESMVGLIDEEAAQWIIKCEKRFGTRPDDLLYSFNKD